jgi:PAS domain S-box-containing protein
MPDEPSAHGARHRWSAGWYLAGLVAVFVITAAAGVVYAAVQTRSDARRAADKSAAHSARTAASELGRDIETLRKTVASLAANPQITATFTNPAACTLSFAASSGLGNGHLDIVRPDGAVACSSAKNTAMAYGHSSWWSQAVHRPVMLAPAADPATRRPAVIAAAPIPGHGVVVAVADLDPVGAELATLYGNGQPVEFLLTTADRSRLLVRSVAAGKWVGRSLRDTPLAGFDGAGEHVGVDGVSRLYESATVPGVGWHLYVGQRTSSVFAAAASLRNRQIVIILIGLVVVLAGTVLAYRRIAMPIKRLREAVCAWSPGDGSPGRIPDDGPAELAALAGDIDGLIDAVARELTGRRRAEDAASASEANYRLLFQASPVAMCICNARDLRIVEANDAFVAQYGYTAERLREMSVVDLADPSDGAMLRNVLLDPAPSERIGPLRQVTADGSDLEVRVTSYPVTFTDAAARVVLLEDVGARERYERQLRQSQRLESLGQLAGGVAHDFNNLLGVILGYTGFTLERVAGDGGADDPGDWRSEVRQNVNEIDQAAQRAARLTHQLLAFARREVVQPTIVDVNAIVNELEPMLRRTLGERVHLDTILTSDPWRIEIDKGQLEQVLVNLAINGRDAMPDGGHLTIDTENIDVDEGYAAIRPGVATGRYLRVRVSDTGEGMDERTLQRAFEPFFTTKPTGKGTGLGLATVYGIITQAGGRAQIYSEPGIGTTFTALFPASEVASATAAPEPRRSEQPGEETILVVEDEAALRDVTAKMLRQNGYTVLTAGDGAEAIEIASSHPDPIDLLITDVVMPGMLGREVAEHITDLEPNIGVLYISGYAEPVLGSQGRLDSDIDFLDKPFSEPALLAKVRTVLARAMIA